MLVLFSDVIFEIFKNLEGYNVPYESKEDSAALEQVFKKALELTSFEVFLNTARKSHKFPTQTLAITCFKLEMG